MIEFAKMELSAWQNFYVIIGSSAAALIGLQFVVIVLIANMRKRAWADAISAFGTPTVLHLGGALFVSAIMSAPWPSLLPPSVALATCGFAGLGYGVIVIRRAHRQKSYEPVWQDWLWHAALPCGVYAALALASFFLRTNSRLALFLIGGAALALLLIGIRNAWDTVTYMVTADSHRDSTKRE